MIKLTKVLSLVLALAMLCSVAFAEEAAYVRGDDDEIYDAVLGDFTALMDAAEAAESIDERFILEAKAEAYLLDSAVMIPTTTQGGAYAITRIAYRTIPYANWGNDDDRWGTMVIANGKSWTGNVPHA